MGRGPAMKIFQFFFYFKMVHFDAFLPRDAYA